MDENRQIWCNEGADLIDALLACNSEDDAHDLLVNYTEEFTDLAQRLRTLGCSSS